MTWTKEQHAALLDIAPHLEAVALRLATEVGPYGLLHMFSSAIAYSIANAAPNVDTLKHSLEIVFEVLTDTAHMVFSEKQKGRT